MEFTQAQGTDGGCRLILMTTHTLKVATWGVLEGYKGTASFFSPGHNRVTSFLIVYELPTWEGVPTLPQRPLGPGGPRHPHTTKVTFAILLASEA